MTRNESLKAALANPDLSLEEAWAAAEAEAAPFSSPEADFKRRNGALPSHNGWPMVSVDGKLVVLNPNHESNHKATAANFKALGLQVLPTNGR